MAGDGARWVPVDLLGRDLGAPGEWPDAEAALEALGLGYLGGVWTLETPSGSERVRLVEVTPRHVTVASDDFGAIDVPVRTTELPFPAPPELRAPA
jgi:hypothetical protein